MEQSVVPLSRTEREIKFIKELLIRQTNLLRKGKLTVKVCIESHARYGFSKIQCKRLNRLISNAVYLENYSVTTMPYGRELVGKVQVEVTWLLKDLFSRLCAA